MGLIAGFLGANVYGKIAICVLVVAEILNWLCFTMNDWGLYDDVVANDDNKKGFGVWKICGNQEPDPGCMELDGWRLEWYGAFQGFVIFGFMGVNLAFVFTILLLFVPQCSDNNELGLVSAICAVVGSVCYIVALIIFGVRFDDTYDAGYDREILQSGFYFAIIIAILGLIVAICAFLGITGSKQIGATTPEASKPREDQQTEMEQTRKNEEKKKRHEEEMQQRQREEEQRRQQNEQEKLRRQQEKKRRRQEKQERQMKEEQGQQEQQA